MHIFLVGALDQRKIIFYKLDVRILAVALRKLKSIGQLVGVTPHLLESKAPNGWLESFRKNDRINQGSKLSKKLSLCLIHSSNWGIPISPNPRLPSFQKHCGSDLSGSFLEDLPSFQMTYVQPPISPNESDELFKVPKL